MTAHTPGPWKVTGNNKLLVEPLGVESHHNEWGSGGGAIIGASQVYNKRTIKEAQANARLIAAAPELLEALKRARIALTFYREWMSAHCPEGNGSTQYPYGIDAENNARAIIAHAEGRK